MSVEKELHENPISGICPLCENASIFNMMVPGQYRSLKCAICGSSSRNRALWLAINEIRPNWRKLIIHECSPGWDLVSLKLYQGCKNYRASQYDREYDFGTRNIPTELHCKKYDSENIESQTYEDALFDMVVMQDVFEHIFDPISATREIARTLKHDGILIMSVPVVERNRLSRRRARLKQGEIHHVLPPEYHGNPIDKSGSLVTIDWGWDIAYQLTQASDMFFSMHTFEDLSYGIKDECNQIIVGWKRPAPSLT